jgi:hypothetical protein
VLCFVFVAPCTPMLFNAGERVFASLAAAAAWEGANSAGKNARFASYGKQFSSLFEMLSPRKKLISPRPRAASTLFFAGVLSHAEWGVGGWTWPTPFSPAVVKFAAVGSG